MTSGNFVKIRRSFIERKLWSKSSLNIEKFAISISIFERSEKLTTHMQQIRKTLTVHTLVGKNHHKKLQ